MANFAFPASSLSGDFFAYRCKRWTDMDVPTPQPGNVTLSVAEAARALLAEPLPVPTSLHAELQSLAAQNSLTTAELAQALAAIGVKHNFGLPPGSAAAPEQQEKFLRALQLPDLAL